MSIARKTVLAALMAMAGTAQAGLLATDAMTGSGDGSGWAAAWSTAGSASFASVGAGEGAITGQALRITGNADNAATRQLGAPISASKVFISFDLQFDSGSIDRNDFLGLWFGSSTGPNMGVKGNCDAGSGCAADLFVRTNSSGGTFTTPIDIGTTYHLYAMLEKVGGASVYNRFSLWVDPTAQERASLTGADAVYNGPSSISSFSTIGWRSANLDGGDAILVDNLALSTVPEPASAALAGLALLGALVTTRRRR